MLSWFGGCPGHEQAGTGGSSAAPSGVAHRATRSAALYTPGKAGLLAYRGTTRTTTRQALLRGRQLLLILHALLNALQTLSEQPIELGQLTLLDALGDQLVLVALRLHCERAGEGLRVEAAP